MVGVSVKKCVGNITTLYNVSKILLFPKKVHTFRDEECLLLK